MAHSLSSSNFLIIFFIHRRYLSASYNQTDLMQRSLLNLEMLNWKFKPCCFKPSQIYTIGIHAMLFLGRLSYRNVISSKYSEQGVTLQYCVMELSLVKVLRFNCPKISLLNQKGLHHFSCSNNVTSTSIGKLPIWKFASRYNDDIKIFCTIQNNSHVIFSSP